MFNEIWQIKTMRFINILRINNLNLARRKLLEAVCLAQLQFQRKVMEEGDRHGLYQSTKAQTNTETCSANKPCTGLLLTL